MTTPTLSPAQHVRRRPYVSAFAANPGRFCCACGVERSQLDRALHHERGGRCEDCADRGIPPMPLTGRCAGRPGEHPAASAPQLRAAGATAVRHTSTGPASTAAAPSPLGESIAVYLALQLDHIAPYERQVGLHAATTIRTSGGSLQQVLAAAARSWFPNYLDMSPSERGRAHTRALRILRAADTLAA
jgi:hypothetical protein